MFLHTAPCPLRHCPKVCFSSGGWSCMSEHLNVLPVPLVPAAALFERAACVSSGGVFCMYEHSIIPLWTLPLQAGLRPRDCGRGEQVEVECWAAQVGMAPLLLQQKVVQSAWPWVCALMARVLLCACAHMAAVQPTFVQPAAAGLHLVSGQCKIAALLANRAAPCACCMLPAAHCMNCCTVPLAAARCHPRARWASARCASWA